MDKREKNHLRGETSPYLIQHSDNPVDWYPWGDEALNRAAKEDKLLLISIGYSACHWCHVMEKESFEDEDVAEIMNKYFISIKVDREERPDIDDIYMNACQLLTGSGGWPLNVVALPNGKPFFAGTYFPKDRWSSVLKKIASYWESDRKKLTDISDSVSEGIRESGKLEFNRNLSSIEENYMDGMYENIKTGFDRVNGGFSGSQKFPLPSTLEFLMTHYFRTEKKDLLSFIKTTLEKMALGGIYDQIGGGFARYSTDSYWKVPHFEKMLYDNAQLLSVYSNAFKLTGELLYKKVAYGIIDFIENEMTYQDKNEGYSAFYSSVDADSNGSEGEFYVWEYKELETLMGENSELIGKYFNISKNGNWEDGKNILFRSENDLSFSKKSDISIDELRNIIDEFRKVAFTKREKRSRPALDTKVVTSWNSLMIKGYVDAFNAFGEKKFLKRAEDGMKFIRSKMISSDYNIKRIFNTKKKNQSINGFLDDFSFTVDAMLSLYSATFNEELLMEASGLIGFCIEHFYDKNSGMFFYTSDLEKELISRNIELTDNVIPSSNSVMALNLLKIGEIFYNEEYMDLSRRMMLNISEKALLNPMFFSKWGVLADFHSSNISEAVFTGQSSIQNVRILLKNFIPGVIIAGAVKGSNLSIVKDRFRKGKSLIFICKNRSCRLPVTDPVEAVSNLINLRKDASDKN